MTKFYVDIHGKYLGGFSSETSALPDNAIEVQTAPSNAADIWSGFDWILYQPTYQQLRAAEYPPMTDYLDGIVKRDQAQVQTYIDACLTVKAKYPKP